MFISSVNYFIILIAILELNFLVNIILKVCTIAVWHAILCAQQLSGLRRSVVRLWPEGAGG